MTSRERTARTPFRVLMTSGVFEPGFRGGGPIRSIAQIVDTAPPGIEIRLITRDRDIGSTKPYPGLSGRWIQRGNAQVFYLNTSSIPQWWRLWRDLRATGFDLLYVNSFWAPTTTVVPLLATWVRVLRVPQILVAPRGELSEGALSVKAGKKRVFLQRWKQVIDRLDVTWHATAPHEAEDIRMLFPAGEVLVVPNQTSLPAEPIAIHAPSADRARLVYISRIVVNKGLHIALEALRHVPEPVQFDIWGPIEDSHYWDRCQSIIEELPQTVDVSYHGAVEPTAVREKFSDYDAFVFPTTGENFGHVIAESLSASCPVVCTDRTPWTEVLEEGGGRALPDGSAAEFGLELKKLTNMSATERQQRRSEAAHAYRGWMQASSPVNVLDVARTSARKARS